MACGARLRVGTILPVEGEDQLQYLWIYLFCCFCCLSPFMENQTNDPARLPETKTASDSSSHQGEKHRISRLEGSLTSPSCGRKGAPGLLGSSHGDCQVT